MRVLDALAAADGSKFDSRRGFESRRSRLLQAAEQGQYNDYQQNQAHTTARVIAPA